MFWFKHSLWTPKVQCRIHKGPVIMPILSGIYPIPRIDTHFFIPKGLFHAGVPVTILKALLPSSIWLHDLPMSVL